MSRFSREQNNQDTIKNNVTKTIESTYSNSLECTTKNVSDLINGNSIDVNSKTYFSVYKFIRG